MPLVAVAVVAAAAVGVWVWTAQSGLQGGSSIAVLPFADLSPAHDQQYLADGMAEEILNLLSKTTTLRVIARTSSFSFRGKDAEFARIAEALGVTHVLEGSVRQAGDRIRVTVRLVNASDGSRVWSESYDREVGDLLALQTYVARSVATELRANLQDLADVPAKGVNPEAYDLYLRGQQKLRWSGYSEAEPYFEQAIAIDPEFIPAYHSLGIAYVGEVVTVTAPMAEKRARLREMVGRGLRLAPDDPGLIALSAQLARFDGDIRLAEKRFAIAQQKDPSNSVLQSVYAQFKLDQGYPQEALALARRNSEIDPLNPELYLWMWVAYMDLGNAKGALAAIEHYRETALPGDPHAEGLTGVTQLLLSGDLAGGIAHNNKAIALAGAGGGIPEWLPQLYYAIGDLQTAESLMEPARRDSWKLSGTEYPMASVEAYRHVVYGDIEEARRLAVATLIAPKEIWAGGERGERDSDLVRLAVDAMIADGHARQAVDFLEKLAPEYARYKATRDIDPQDFSPAPVQVKSAFSSYPALYFPDYARALRAAGDEAGADQMLDHLEAILELRRKRGLIVEGRHAAEALALHGKTEAALDALEQGERDRTIYHCWQLCLLHNEIFAGFRDHPRFVALVERIQRDLSRQREELRRMPPPMIGSNQ
jgi:TolB-like protein/Flp pilus assembly protein TadD